MVVNLYNIFIIYIKYYVPTLECVYIHKYMYFALGQARFIAGHFKYIIYSGTSYHANSSLTAKLSADERTCTRLRYAIGYSTYLIISEVTFLLYLVMVNFYQVN